MADNSRFSTTETSGKENVNKALHNNSPQRQRHYHCYLQLSCEQNIRYIKTRVRLVEKDMQMRKISADKYHFHKFMFLVETYFILHTQNLLCPNGLEFLNNNFTNCSVLIDIFTRLAR